MDILVLDPKFGQIYFPESALYQPLSVDYVTQTFRKACGGDLGISDFRFHDLRHTAASWLRMSGADIHLVATLFGHKDLRMAARYQHLSKEFLAETVENSTEFSA